MQARVSEAPKVRSVLVALGGSDRARDIALAAREWTELLDTDVHVVHVVLPDVARDPTRRARAASYVASVAREAGFRMRGAPVVIEGRHVWAGILYAAQAVCADAIVVGAPAREERDRLSAILRPRCRLAIYEVQARPSDGA